GGDAASGPGARGPACGARVLSRGPALAVEGLTRPEQLRQVLLLPGQGVAVPGVQHFRLTERARVVDGAAGAVGHAPEVVVEHLVVDDALQEVEGHVAAV